MEQFPHLNFVQKITGRPRIPGGGTEKEITRANKANRQGHSDFLSAAASRLKSNWSIVTAQREEQGLPPLDANIVPVFLQINPGLLLPDFDLAKLGIEIISEEEEGYIIGASFDDLQSLEQKITGFIDVERGTAIIADLWKIVDGNREEWKPKHILSEELYAKWHDIVDEQSYTLEVGIAFDKSLGEEPDANKRGGAARLEKYHQKLIERDEQLRERETHFENFINHYGTITSDFVHWDDSFGCKVIINGKGLKDLVFNYPFVFEVNEAEEMEAVQGALLPVEIGDLEVLSPDKNATVVSVIDSGIMESHRYISAGIDRQNSKSYIDGDASVADHVNGGGHGTRVAGAVLYPQGVSGLITPYKLPCFIRNLRVLDGNNYLQNRYPAQLINQIIEENKDCALFNLSINSKAPFRKKHMSAWAAIIDKLTHEKDILFIISAGNLPRDHIRECLSDGCNYPDYLDEVYCKIANPAQSSFALTVGSVNHSDFEDENWKSLGEENHISAFSRIGTGIWGSIKPDVVEYGGGLVSSKNGIYQIKEHNEMAPELIRSTLHGGGAIGRDCVGTSFAAPKVANIVAALKQLYPGETVNLLRAFVAQGARLPGEHFQNPSTKSISYFGYGLPSIERVTKNNEHRITFYNTGMIRAEEAHIYTLKIPETIRGQGDEYDILIEITLAYTAKIRRTRQKIKSYLSTWLDWTTSKLGESYDQFKDYALSEIEEERTEYDADARGNLNNFNWKIKDRPNFGTVQDISRNNSTLQKDWTIIKSYELPDEISIAVRGHKGWDKNKEEVPYAITVSIEILGTNIPIYETIRIENEIEIEVNV